MLNQPLYFPWINRLFPDFENAISLQDIANSCHEVTATVIEPPQKNFDEKISKILGASSSQSLDIKRV